ncbi:MAG: tetratricopeptide repeat protein [Candidatus Thermoplasmatota archaeon]
MKKFLTVEDKILLHLYEYTKYSEGFESPFAVTQDGIGEAIGVERSHIPRAVKSGIDKGLISERTSRVSGKERVRKVYFLSWNGVSKANELRAKLLDEVVTLRLEDDKEKEIKIGEIAEFLGLKLSLSQIIKCIEDSCVQERKLRRILESAQGYVDFSLKAPKLRHFFGREKELTDIDNWLNSEEYSFMVIHGMPGIGKTTLALKVISNYKDKKNVFWYQFHEWDVIRSLLLPLGEFLELLNRRKLYGYLKTKKSVELSEISDILEEELQNINAIVVLDDCHKMSESLKQFFSLSLNILERIRGVKLILLTRHKLPFYDRTHVLIKKLVREMELEGLDVKSSKELLKIEITEKEWKNLYKMTGGHPLLLELIVSVKDIKKEGAIMKYIHEEIFSKLPEDEKHLLEIQSVYGYPVPPRAILIDEQATHATLDRLVSKALIHETPYGTYAPHDIVKEFFYSRISKPLRESYHLKAAEYYLTESGDRACIEAQFHFLMANEYERAWKLVKEYDEGLIERGYLEELLPILEKFTHENIGINNTYAFVFTLLLRGNIFSILGEWERAMKYYNSCLELCEKSSKLELRKLLANTYICIGNVKKEKSDWKEAIRFFEKGKEVATDIKEDKFIGFAFGGLGYVYWRTGKWDSAIGALGKYMDYGNKLKDEKMIATAHIDLGNVYSDMGDCDKALNYYEKGLGLLKAEGAVREMARVYNNIGTIYFYNNQMEMALENYNKNIKFSEESGDIPSLAYGLSNAGEVYVKLHDFKKANEHLDKALQIFKKIDNKYMISTNYIAYGIMYRLKKDWEKAEKYFKDGIEILLELNMPYDLAEAYYEFALVYLDEGEKKTSKKYLDKALEIYEKLGAKKDIEKIMRVLNV